MQLSTILNAQVGDKVNIAKPGQRPIYVQVTNDMKKRALDFYQTSQRADSVNLPADDPLKHNLKNEPRQILPTTATDDITVDTVPKGTATPDGYKSAADTNQEMYNKINQRATAPMSPAPNKTSNPPIDPKIVERNSQHAQVYADRQKAQKDKAQAEWDKRPTGHVKEGPIQDQSQYIKEYAANQKAQKDKAQAEWDAAHAEGTPTAVEKTPSYPEASFANVANAKPGDIFIRSDGSQTPPVTKGDINWAKDHLAKTSGTTTSAKPKAVAKAEPAKSEKKPAPKPASTPQYKEDDMLVGSIKGGDFQNQQNERVAQLKADIAKASDEVEHENPVAASPDKAPPKAPVQVPPPLDVPPIKVTPILAQDTVSDDRMKNILAGVQPPAYTLHDTADTSPYVDDFINSVNG